MCIPNLQNTLAKSFFPLSLLIITGVSLQHIPVLSKYVINAILHYDIKSTLTILKNFTHKLSHPRQKMLDKILYVTDDSDMSRQLQLFYHTTYKKVQ